MEVRFRYQYAPDRIYNIDESTLNLSLRHSSPTERTGLRKANIVFNAQIREPYNIPLPLKGYAERMTRALKTTQSALVTIQKELTKQRELLQT